MSRQQACPVGHLGPPVKQLGGVPGDGCAHTGVGFSTGQIISWAENKQNSAFYTLKLHVKIIDIVNQANINVTLTLMYIWCVFTKLKPLK